MKDFYVEKRGGTLVVSLLKEVDHHMARKVREEVDALLDKGTIKYLLLDFEGVDFMDSSGIGMIMGRYKKIKFLGGEMRISGVKPGVERIFAMSGLYQLGIVYRNLESAMAGIN